MQAYRSTGMRAFGGCGAGTALAGVMCACNIAKTVPFRQTKTGQQVNNPSSPSALALLALEVPGTTLRNARVS